MAVHFLVFFNNFGLKQLIQNSTRITDTNSSLIDHLYSYYPDGISVVSVPTVTMSDHLPVCIPCR